MPERTDYAKVIEKTNYPALEKKLEEASRQGPPKKRKSAADALAPVAEKLLEMRGHGWSYRQLTEELKACGLPVNVTAVREYLRSAQKKRKAAGRKSVPA